MKDPVELCEKIQIVLARCAREVHEAIVEYRDDNSSLGASAAAKYLEMSTQTLRRLEKSGKLVPKRTLGSNYRMYTKGQLDAYAAGKPTTQKIDQTEEDEVDEEEFGSEEDQA